MKLNLPTPPWLTPGKEMTEQRHAELKAIVQNWVKLFNSRHGLSEKDCLNLICMELLGKKRPDIIARLKHWYNVRRHDREVKELWAAQAEKKP
jgi:hypothetical protein